jgi:uncharacterized membrane protein YfcA
MTPFFALSVGMPLAVAAVSIPHAIATALRCWRLRGFVSLPVLRSFGVWSAIGGLLGAVLFTRTSSRALGGILGLLLIATSLAAIVGARWKPPARAASPLGFGSGLFGGLAGNQGGLRAAALLTFSLTPVEFVATSTAVGLLIDAARLPVYLWQGSVGLMNLAGPIAIGTVGVVIGTLLGERILLGLGAERFKRIIGLLIGGLGTWLLFQAVQPSF